MTARNRYRTPEEYLRARERDRRARNRAALERARSGETVPYVPGKAHPWRRPYKLIPDLGHHSRART